MARLVKQLGPEAQRDPSLLHPLFARLPPLYCDTPDAPTPPTTAPPPTSPHAEPNPYTPIALSTVFKLADKLFAKFPPDGPVTRAHEVLGQGSMVRTYSRERDEDWGLRDAEAAIDSDVILPGGDEADEDASLVPDCRLSPRRLDHLSTAVAVGIVVVGIGAAVLGWQGRHADPQWARFWGMVATQAAAKSNSLINSWVAVNSYFTRTLREVL
jgi:hypothetical protein